MHVLFLTYRGDLGHTAIKVQRAKERGRVPAKPADEEIPAVAHPTLGLSDTPIGQS